MKLRNIRIFHYDKDSGEYVYSDYRGTAEIEEGGQSEDGGVRRRCDGSVRLMTSAEISAAPGDYVSLGIEKEPDKNRDYYIIVVKDNRRGSLPHWRLLLRRRNRL